MITIKITRQIYMAEVDAMLDWLKDIDYKFTGDGIELITFNSIEDATAFKLRFGV